MPPTVTLFVHWLYTQQFPATTEDWIDMEVIRQVSDWPEDDLVYACIKAYAFGDRFLAPNFCKVSNNFFVDTIKTCTLYAISEPSRTSISYAFDNIPGDIVILQCLVDIFCMDYGAKRSFPHLVFLEAFPRAFLRRVIYRFRQLSLMSKADKEEENRCYLEHASDEEKRGLQGVAYAV
jgi:hypothetical protein